MADVKTVIKALECCYCNFPTQMDCKNCPYDKICYHDKACSLMLRDALALLKEQDGKIKTLEDLNAKLMLLVNEYLKKEREEAVEPYIAGNGESFETTETWWYECGNCNKPIDPNDKFCRHCGQAVKWE